MDEPNPTTPTPPSPAPAPPAPTPTPVPEPPRSAPNRGGLPVHEASASSSEEPEGDSGSEEPEDESRAGARRHDPDAPAADGIVEENTSPIPNAVPFDRTVDPAAGGPREADTSTDYATRRPQELEPRSEV